MKQRLRNSTGITLVALVVTIVVLLILAGITIMYTMGDNSIFKKAQEAKDKTEEAVKNEQEYMNSIDNMVNGYIDGTGNGEGNTTTEPENPWEKIDRIAKAIANDESITNNSTQATGTTEKGESYDIKVGDTLEVEYNGEIRRVRILGFKHDDLVDKTVYGGTHEKASISFEFLDFMTGNTYMAMNTTNTNTNGWAATQMRKDLNGYSNGNATQSGAIGGLAASEVVNAGYQSGAYGFCIGSEGSQYKYYQGVTEEWNGISKDCQKRPNSIEGTNDWWLRSPYFDSSDSFCDVKYDGGANDSSSAHYNSSVAPGFCI